ncbi:MAG: hypothetical protein KIS73_18790 [Enhydrobacter sp.]|nr:hypothetical protein [Enhydrobacter sp.]
MKGPAWAVAAVLFAGCQAVAQSPADSAQNSANNPLTPKSAIQLQDYFQPLLAGRPGQGANQGIVRTVLPHDIMGVDQLARASLPVISNVWGGPTGAVNGIGDLTVFNMAVFHRDFGKVGIGPLIVAPTASDSSLGYRKWQAGVQTIVSAPHKWGLTSALTSYQQSFDGKLQTLTAQPLLFYNLERGLYLRSTGIASFNFGDTPNSVVPVGLGLGHVTQLANGTVVNVFVEPQYSVVQTGAGVPSFQIFAGMVIQFPRAPPRPR